MMLCFVKLNGIGNLITQFQFQLQRFLIFFSINRILSITFLESCLFLLSSTSTKKLWVLYHKAPVPANKDTRELMLFL